MSDESTPRDDMFSHIKNEIKQARKLSVAGSAVFTEKAILDQIRNNISKRHSFQTSKISFIYFFLGKFIGYKTYAESRQNICQMFY